MQIEKEKSRYEGTYIEPLIRLLETNEHFCKPVFVINKRIKYLIYS